MRKESISGLETRINQESLGMLQYRSFENQFTTVPLMISDTATSKDPQNGRIGAIAQNPHQTCHFQADIYSHAPLCTGVNQSDGGKIKHTFIGVYCATMGFITTIGTLTLISSYSAPMDV